MATMKVEGLDIFHKQFEKLTKEVSNINSMALYDAAGVVADELEAAMDKLPVRADGEYGTAQHKLYGATQSEKNQLIDALGVARFRKTGDSKDTSIGFHGYVSTPSKKYGDQVPAGMLMQCIEYGTKFRQGTHTLTSAMKSCKSKAEKAFQERLDQEVNKIMD